MIRLERSPAARLVSGARLQAFYATLLVLVTIRVLGMAAGLIDDQSLPLIWTVLVDLVLAAVVGLGAAGYAEADETGVRWRYYLAHDHTWNEIEQIELQVIGVSLVGLRHLMFVRVGGRRVKVTPGCGHGRDQRRFAQELLALASGRGIAVVDGWGVTATPPRPAA